MPLTDSKPDALARVYAASLFELSDANSEAEAVLGELEDILELARADATFGEFLSSRVVDDSRRGDSLKAIFGGRASDLTLKFLGVLNEKGRLGHLPAIVAALDELVQERFGRVEVDVFTAEPMDPDTLNGVRDRLTQSIGKDAIVHPYTDPAMIGGIKLRIGDQLIDGSVQSQLRQIKDKLATDGSAELRARFDRILDEEG